MRYACPFFVTSAIVLCFAACTPPDPVGREAAPVASEPAADVATGVEVSPPESQVAVAEEPLALRFLTPNIGPPAGGNEVTIDGQGFSQYPRVAFGGVPAWIRSVTSTEIRVFVPAPAGPIAVGEPLVVDVMVTNPPESSSTPVSETLVQAYSYVDTSAGTAVAEKAPEPPPAPAVAKIETAAGADADIGEGSRERGSPESPQSEKAATSRPTLVASFSFETVTDSEDCAPPNTSIIFTDRSTGGVTAWRWDFGDGSTSGERHQEHCYTAPGMRSVTLTVSNDQESASTSKIVTAGME